MRALIRKSSPEALELVVRGAIASGQYIIECRGPLEDFDREYFAVSGYFGVHGPHLFAAAPELLAALEFVTSCLTKELGNLADEDELADEDAPGVLGKDYAKQVIAARLRIRQAKSAIAKARGAA